MIAVSRKVEKKCTKTEEFYEINQISITNNNNGQVQKNFSYLKSYFWHFDYSVFISSTSEIIPHPSTSGRFQSADHYQPEEVPEYVPRWADLVIFKANSLEFLDAKEAKEFKRQLMLTCPCQKELKIKCPFESCFADVHLWFDDHVRPLQDWTYPVKYVCNCNLVTYRHWHDSDRFRARLLSRNDFIDNLN